MVIGIFLVVGCKILVVEQVIWVRLMLILFWVRLIKFCFGWQLLLVLQLLIQQLVVIELLQMVMIGWGFGLINWLVFFSLSLVRVKFWLLDQMLLRLVLLVVMILMRLCLVGKVILIGRVVLQWCYVVWLICIVQQWLGISGWWWLVIVKVSWLLLVMIVLIILFRSGVQSLLFCNCQCFRSKLFLVILVGVKSLVI